MNISVYAMPPKMPAPIAVFLAPNLCISFGEIGVIMKLGMPVNEAPHEPDYAPLPSRQQP